MTTNSDKRGWAGMSRMSQKTWQPGFEIGVLFTITAWVVIRALESILQ